MEKYNIIILFEKIALLCISRCNVQSKKNTQITVIVIKSVSLCFSTLLCFLILSPQIDSVLILIDGIVRRTVFVKEAIKSKYDCNNTSRKRAFHTMNK